MTTTATRPAAKTAAAAKPAAAKATKASAPKPEPKKAAPKKQAAPKPTPDSKLVAQVQAARAAGHTCRSLTRAMGVTDDGRGSELWRIAGMLDAISHGRGVRFQDGDAARIAAVLTKVEKGELAVPERATRKPSTSGKAQAIHALEAATAEKTIAGKQKLITEALHLLGVTTTEQ